MVSDRRISRMRKMSKMMKSWIKMKRKTWMTKTWMIKTRVTRKLSSLENRREPREKKRDKQFVKAAKVEWPIEAHKR